MKTAVSGYGQGAPGSQRRGPAVSLVGARIRKCLLESSLKDWQALGGQRKVCLGMQVVAEYDWLVS